MRGSKLCTCGGTLKRESRSAVIESLTTINLASYPVEGIEACVAAEGNMCV